MTDTFGTPFQCALLAETGCIVEEVFGRSIAITALGQRRTDTATDQIALLTIQCARVQEVVTQLVTSGAVKKGGAVETPLQIAESACCCHTDIWVVGIEKIVSLIITVVANRSIH